MPPDSYTPLWRRARLGAGTSEVNLAEGDVRLRLADLEHRSLLKEKAQTIRGRCALVATDDQISAAVLLLELDGIARRIVVVPPGTAESEVIDIYRSAEADSIIANRCLTGFPPEKHIILGPGVELKPYSIDRTGPCETSWVLLTSGTSGRPRLVEHKLDGLTGAITRAAQANVPIVWSTFYDIRRYGGLQILLRALLTGASLILRKPGIPVAQFLLCAGAAGVTHMSGTPSHWRIALMSSAASEIRPAYIRLSGEIADQTVLDGIRSMWPRATIVHAFASTEAGVAFEVKDGQAGFPLSLIHHEEEGDVEIQIRGSSLCIRSLRIANRYLGREPQSIAGPDGFVDTGDMVELRDGRYYFAGRRDGTINVGGLKIHPEEVEGVLNRHPRVRISVVRTRKSPITGSLVVADVVLRDAQDSERQPSSQVQHELLHFCSQTLPRHKVPAVINIVENVSVNQTGKLRRSYV
jgi:acyl-coenzyme A synthetase/AMP-(fatty) acid ligase